MSSPVVLMLSACGRARMAARASLLCMRSGEGALAGTHNKALART